MRTTKRVLGGFAAAIAAAVAAAGTAGAADKEAAAKTPGKAALVELGRRLFMDPAASRLGRNSCASCHDPERGFSDPRPRSVDDAGPTRRHSQTLIDLAGEGFHWDGEFDTVRELLVARVAPITDVLNAASARVQRRVTAAQAEKRSRQLDFPVPAFAVPYYRTEDLPGPVTPSAVRLASDGRYDEAFAATFGTTHPTTVQIVDALDAYCASIRSTTNAFDRFRAGDDAALTESAKRGLALFEGRAGCAACHLSAPAGGRTAFTDGKFHDTGISTRAEPRDLPARDDATGAAAKIQPDLGRQETTFLARNGRRFKTPTLRDVALRAPYMHDASIATLADVVRYYSAGGTPHDGLDLAVKPLDLTDAEVADLVAFLESLTGATRAGLGFAPPDVKPLRVKILGTDGKPLAGFRFDAAPYGDGLLGDAPERVATSVTTGADGVAVIDRPLATHVMLTSATHRIEMSRPIPDTCASRTLVAVPNGKIALRLRRHPSYPAFPEEIAVGGGRKGNPAPTALLRRAAVLSVNEVLYVGDVNPASVRDAREGAGAPVDCTISVGLDSYDVTVVPAGGMFEPLLLRE
jgi:cytochrome c peroxidase